jgi:hypothetical protein
MEIENQCVDYPEYNTQNRRFYLCKSVLIICIYPCNLCKSVAKKLYWYFVFFVLLISTRQRARF